MKKSIIIALVLSVGLFTSAPAQAQGTLYVSNLDKIPSGNVAVGNDSRIAQTFSTGTNPGGYILNSIQLLMNTASGTPGNFAVSVFSKTGDPHSVGSGDSPFFPVGHLIGSTNPSAGGLFTYTTSDTLLLPSTFYFLVVTAATPVAQGAYNWSFSNGMTVANQWGIDNLYLTSVNGSIWTSGSPRQAVFQLGIYATPVPTPEPGTGALICLGLAGLCLWRRKKRGVHL